MANILKLTQEIWNTLNSVDWLVCIIVVYGSGFLSRRQGVQIGPITIPLYWIPIWHFIFYHFYDYNWGIKILVGLVSFVVLLFLNIIENAENRSIQKKRDQQAEDLKTKILSVALKSIESIPVYSLYLRPFSTTNLLPTQLEDSINHSSDSQ